jgi:hypothetical protein
VTGNVVGCSSSTPCGAFDFNVTNSFNFVTRTGAVNTMQCNAPSDGTSHVATGTCCVNASTLPTTGGAYTPQTTAAAGNTGFVLQPGYYLVNFQLDLMLCRLANSPASGIEVALVNNISGTGLYANIYTFGSVTVTNTGGSVPNDGNLMSFNSASEIIYIPQVALLQLYLTVLNDGNYCPVVSPSNAYRSYIYGGSIGAVRMF